MKFLILTLIIFSTAQALAQISIDPTFATGGGPDVQISKLAKQSDGKIIIAAAALSKFGAYSPSSVARLNPDGSFDLTYLNGFGCSSSSTIDQLVVDSSDRIIIVGTFTSFNGFARNGIVRLKSDGNMDTGFDPGSRANGPITGVTIGTFNSKLYVTGSFSNYDGVSEHGIARINDDGTLDNTFNVGGNSYGLQTIQANGQLIASKNNNQLVRLNLDGSIDGSYNSTIVGYFVVPATVITPDNKVIAAFGFGSSDGWHSQVYRFNSDGSVDAGFKAGVIYPNYSSVFSLALQDDGKILVGGYLANIYDGTVQFTSYGVLRLNADGSTDMNFKSPASDIIVVEDVLAQSNDETIVSGNFPGNLTFVRLIPPPSPPPTIISFSPAAASAGSTVTITGTNFSSDKTRDVVYFGATKAAVQSATASQLVVTVPVGATYEPISVLVGRLIAYSDAPFTITLNGSGTLDSFSFTQITELDNVVWPYSLAINDFDGDGLADIVVANSSDNSISVIRNKSTPGNPNYDNAINFGVGGEPKTLVAADIDGDGMLDIIVGNHVGSSISVLKNTSSGPGSISFASQLSFSTGENPVSIAVQDFDMDGKADVVVLVDATSNAVSMLKNIGTESVPVKFDIPISFSSANSPASLLIAVGDVDNDHRPDFAVTNSSSNTFSIYHNSNSVPGILSFDPHIDFETPSNPTSLAISDLDGDRLPEILVCSTDTISVFGNTSSAPGSVNFLLAKKIFNSGTENIAISDLNGDARPDIITTNGAIRKNLSVFRNKSAGKGAFDFDSNLDYPLQSPTDPASVSVADLDGDDKPDLAVANGIFSAFITVLTNTESIQPLAPVIYSLTPDHGPVETAVQLTGTNFDPVYSQNNVMIGGVQALVLSGIANTLNIQIPLGATTDFITVKVQGVTAISSEKFIVTAPTISIDLQPESQTVCTGSATFRTLASGTSNISYHWQYSTSVSGPFNYLSETIATVGVATKQLLINPTDNTLDGFFRCEITGDDATTIYTNPAQLSVNFTNTIEVTPTIVGCSPTIVTLSAAGGVDGYYNWLNSAYQFIQGEVNSTYQFIFTSATTVYVYYTNGPCTSPIVSIPVNFTGNCNGPVISTSTNATFAPAVIAFDLTKLVQSQDDLDATSISAAVSSGAPVSHDGLSLKIDYTNKDFISADELTLHICTVKGNCSDGIILIEFDGTSNPGTIAIYNAVSPNGDTKNPVFFISNIDESASTGQNKVTIFNRWGDEVYSVNDYNNIDRVFSGVGKDGGKLPTGTYFYRIEFMSGLKPKTGFISLKY